jgi:hypothetical protein
MIEIIPLLEFVKDYPWFAPLMAALFILAAIAFMTKMVMLALSNTQAIKSIVNAALPAKKSLKTLALAEEEADQELDSLAADFGADRACIGLFHNGRTSLGSVHLLSFSIKAEGSSGKFPRIAGRIQSIPLQTYGSWTRKVIIGASIEAPDSSISKVEAPCAYPILEQHSVKSIYIYPVVTPAGEIDGCVFLEYCQFRRELGQVEKEQIRARGQSIYTKLHEANNV